MITIRKYTDEDIEDMVKIWNTVVEDGIAFPQEDKLSFEEGKAFFAGQTFCGVAEDSDIEKVVGLYILHPNNVGRCGHICNASYAVDAEVRGLHIGEKLVKHSISQAAKEQFRILQFNAVVKTNVHARNLYERCGFTQLGTIPKGFRMKDGHYEDICPYYIEVV
ncbi:MAG: GNAT family N-acetyltransferase [Lachnospiraceae bacterium]|nr:GNAT family N-acetyltransferase [Lachnospiraceae bacterium]